MQSKRGNRDSNSLTYGIYGVCFFSSRLLNLSLGMRTTITPNDDDNDDYDNPVFPGSGIVLEEIRRVYRSLQPCYAYHAHLTSLRSKEYS